MDAAPVLPLGLAPEWEPGVPYTVGGADMYFAAWLAHQLEVDLEELLPCSACGIMMDGEIVAAVVFNEYRIMTRGSTMQASVASINPRWATRTVLKHIFAYPFLQQKVTRLWASTSRKNKHARKFLERVGFTYEGMARRAYNGTTDAAVYSMLPDECKWIR